MAIVATEDTNDDEFNEITGTTTNNCSTTTRHINNDVLLML